jgi:hypothetical protein
MRMVGGVIQAQILRITPKDFQTHLSPHFYNFSWLDWTGNAGCNIDDKMLVANDPPNIDNVSIIRQFLDYDLGRASVEPSVLLGGEQAKVNKSNYYWHERLNSDPCWNKMGLKAFDTGDGNFHNVSLNGFLNIVAFAQNIHKAPLGYTAISQIRQDVSTETHKSFFKKKVKTTVSYYLKPMWFISTPKKAGDYSDYEANPTLTENGTYSFIKAMNNHSFPEEEMLVYQWDRT